MAPEVIMLVALSYMFYTSKKSKDGLVGLSILTILLIWGNFFNDIWGFICAGFTGLFN